MKQTNKKYISKEMAMMAALTTESMLLHLNYDAMLFWNAASCYYCVIVNYVNTAISEILETIECTEYDTYEDALGLKKEITMHFQY